VLCLKSIAAVNCEFIWLQSDIINLRLQKEQQTLEEFGWKMEFSSVCSDLLTAQITSPEITESTHSSAFIIIKISIIFVIVMHTLYS